MNDLPRTATDPITVLLKQLHRQIKDSPTDHRVNVVDNVLHWALNMLVPSSTLFEGFVVTRTDAKDFNDGDTCNITPLNLTLLNTTAMTPENQERPS